MMNNAELVRRSLKVIEGNLKFIEKYDQRIEGDVVWDWNEVLTELLARSTYAIRGVCILLDHNNNEFNRSLNYSVSLILRPILNDMLKMQYIAMNESNEESEEFKKLLYHDTVHHHFSWAQKLFKEDLTNDQIDHLRNRFSNIPHVEVSKDGISSTFQTTPISAKQLEKFFTKNEEQTGGKSVFVDACFLWNLFSKVEHYGGFSNNFF